MCLCERRFILLFTNSEDKGHYISDPPQHSLDDYPRDCFASRGAAESKLPGWNTTYLRDMLRGQKGAKRRTELRHGDNVKRIERNG